jgi:hypothetical protein
MKIASTTARLPIQWQCCGFGLHPAAHRADRPFVASMFDGRGAVSGVASLARRGV